MTLAATMTKLQLLSGFLTERLTAVLKEILDVVEEAASESQEEAVRYRDEAARYREEAARYREENGRLRRQLRDILLLEAETQWISKTRAEFWLDPDQNRAHFKQTLSALQAPHRSRDVVARQFTLETSLLMRKIR